ncbi:MAG: hypothetical protein U0559_10630 [Anaerolineae bacterium]
MLNRTALLAVAVLAAVALVMVLAAPSVSSSAAGADRTAGRRRFDANEVATYGG